MSNLVVLPNEAELSAELREQVIVCEEVDYATFHDEELLSMWCDLRSIYVLQENVVLVNCDGRSLYHHYRRELELGLDDFDLDDGRTLFENNIEPIFAVRSNDDGRRRVMADAAPEPACKRNRTLSDQSERFVARADYGFPACEC